MAKKKAHRKHRRNPGNPSWARTKGIAKRTYHKARGFMEKHDIFSAAKTAIPILGGVLLALMFRKKFGGSEGVESKWVWKDYLMCLLGGFAGMLGARGLFHVKDHSAQMLFLGSVILAGYKALEEQIVPQSTMLQNWLGDDDASEYEGAYSQDFGYRPGDQVVDSAGNAQMLGDDGIWRPSDDEEIGIGDGLRQPGSLGDGLRQPGSLGGWSSSTLQHAA